MPTFVSKKGQLAVIAPKFEKIEAKLNAGGFATIGQRHELIACDLVMDYTLDGVKLTAGKDKVLLFGGAGLQAWAKKIYSINGKEFSLCPENEVIGYQKASEPTACCVCNSFKCRCDKT